MCALQAELSELVKESESYGPELARWRQAVVDRKASVIHVAQDALDSTRRGEDYQETVRVMEKYKGFCPEAEPNWEGLQRRSEELLDQAQEVRAPTTWTRIRHDGPDHLVL